MKTKYIIGLGTIAAGVAIVLNKTSIYDLYCWAFHKHYWGGGNYEICLDCHPHRKLAVPLSNMDKLEKDVHIPYWIKNAKI